MNVLETEWWTMALPPEWWADSEDDSILVGDRDDVGCIEISTLHKERGEFSQAEVQEIANTQSDSVEKWDKVTLGDFQGVLGKFVEEGAAIREWYVMCGPMLLFITYSCDEDNGGMDDAAVDELLDTLALVSAAR
ncbi:MAG: hypothetical protein H6985_19455 [Pseudomonadales bacterium]|nr:hypothetical protein [Halioglobus sp.]MCP5131748.1 hypothetical protein [Pseudomonadales bacterium]